jgi:hypothetical protein
LADDATILRLLTFTTADGSPAFDIALRDELLPEFEIHQGLVDAYAGRRGTAETGQRVVASMWLSRGAMATALAEAPEMDRLRPLQANEARNDRLEILDLAFGLHLDRSAPARLLRVFRGEVRPGGLEAYADDVHIGALRDAQAVDGMVALYFALDPPSRFVTVSAWTDWEAIAEATGGSIHRPIATRHPDHIVAATADHYEIVPDTEWSGVRASVAALH